MTGVDYYRTLSMLVTVAQVVAGRNSRAVGNARRLPRMTPGHALPVVNGTNRSRFVVLLA